MYKTLQPSGLDKENNNFSGLAKKTNYFSGLDKETNYFSGLDKENNYLSGLDNNYPRPAADEKKHPKRPETWR